MLVEVAYDVKENQVAGGSALLDSRYNVAAKADGEPDRDRMRLMIRSLLADRFGLTLHREVREVLVYAMIQDKGGIKMRVSPAELPADEDSRGISNGGRGQVGGRWASMRGLANVLSNYVGRPVIDKTELSGVYDFSLRFAATEGEPIEHAPAEANDSLPSVFTALPAQLGLRLESGKVPVETLVIDQVTKPTAN